VGGDEEARHGIVLAKNDLAKKCKIQTGEAVISAKRKCSELVSVPPNYPLYMKYSSLMREIYLNYTDLVENFGLDEAWIDITNSLHLFGKHSTPDECVATGKQIADTIRSRMWQELGVTVSVGVSYNKIFAKLGSDMKKPDATTVITRSNYKQTVWTLPVSDLMYVGHAYTKHFAKLHIFTIGQLARMNPKVLRGLHGMMGEVLWLFANGEDPSTVSKADARAGIKSIGNSMTCIHDVTADNDIRIALYILSESVASRLRECGFFCRTVELWVCRNDFVSYTRQAPASCVSQDSNVIFATAYQIYKRHRSPLPIRKFGVRAKNLVGDDMKQLSLMPDAATVERHERFEYTVDTVRNRFGNEIMRRGIMLTNRRLAGVNPKEDHMVFPVSYFG